MATTAFSLGMDGNVALKCAKTKILAALFHSKWQHPPSCEAPHFSVLFHPPAVVEPDRRRFLLIKLHQTVLETRVVNDHWVLLIGSREEVKHLVKAL